MSCPFVKIFFNKTYFSVHITHYSINFIWFALSATKYLMTYICSILNHSDLSSFWKESKWKFLWDKMIFTLNQFQTKQSHIYKEKILKKNYFTFSLYLFNDFRIYIYIYISKVGDQKAPFSIATTPTCRGGRYSLPWIAPLYPWYVPYIAECKARRYQVLFLKSSVWRDMGLHPGTPNHWRTLYPLG